jgi:predicted CXXCH cytochrome family protein
MTKELKYKHAPFAKGQCDSCHQPHQSSYIYLLKNDPEALCLNCHKREVLLRKHSNFPAELGQCGTCHNPHGSDRPNLIRNILHPPYEESCDNCHTGKGKPIPRETCFGCHPDVTEQMASSHNHLVRYGDNGCMACHSPHASDDKRLLKGKERHVCGKCHESTFKRYEAIKFKHTFTDACNNCHAPHGSNHPAMFKDPISSVCDNCHGLHGNFSHPIGEGVYDPRTGQMMTCASCHASKGSEYPYHTRASGTKELCVRCHSIE